MLFSEAILRTAGVAITLPLPLAAGVGGEDSVAMATDGST